MPVENIKQWCLDKGFEFVSFSIRYTSTNTEYQLVYWTNDGIEECKDFDSIVELQSHLDSY